MHGSYSDDVTLSGIPSRRFYGYLSMIRYNHLLRCNHILKYYMTSIYVLLFYGMTSPSFTTTLRTFKTARHITIPTYLVLIMSKYPDRVSIVFYPAHSVLLIVIG